VSAASAPTSRPIVACQSCGHEPLEPILFLGYVPPVNTMPVIGEVPVEQTAYPLGLVRCERCTLVQAGLEVDKEVLFPPGYPYRSRSTGILRENFADLCRESTGRLALAPEALVVDVGSNDGTLLSNFHEAGHPVLGIEPTDAAQDATARGIRTWQRYFGADVAREVRSELGPAGLVTAANVFAHIAGVHDVLDAIESMLADDGVFVSESHDLLSLVRTLQYDTVYHEHLRYYSLGSLKALFAPHGFEVFHVKRIPTHGGSIRVYAARAGQQKIDPSVAAVQAEEDQAGLSDGSALEAFRRSVTKSKLDLLALLAPLKAEGHRVYGIGAPSRASTLINHVGLDENVVEAVMELGSSPKVGRYVPGTRIPVLDEQLLFEDQPPYALLLSWHIADALVAALRRKGYRGRFVTPLPEPRILDA
jgi:hypothetical protein